MLGGYASDTSVRRARGAGSGMMDEPPEPEPEPEPEPNKPHGDDERESEQRQQLAKIDAAFAESDSGALTRGGVAALLQRLGRHEGWYAPALAQITDNSLRMSAGACGTVGAETFRHWWLGGGHMDASQQLEQRIGALSKSFDRLSSALATRLSTMGTICMLGGQQRSIARGSLVRTVSEGGAAAPDATADIMGRPQFPMFVVRCADVLELSSPLPQHEELLSRGLLLEVEELDDRLGTFQLYRTDSIGQRGSLVRAGDEQAGRSGSGQSDGETAAAAAGEPLQYSRNRFIAVSHQWLRPSPNAVAGTPAHPDSADGVKLKALKQHLGRAVDADNFLWMDYISIPQAPGSRVQQMLAIRSIPTYFMYSTTMLVLATAASFFDLDDGYLSRGHCLLELATARLPRLDVFGKWYLPGCEHSGQWGSVVLLDYSDSTAATELLAPSDPRLLPAPPPTGVETGQWQRQAGGRGSLSPLAGRFTVEADRALVASLLQTYISHHQFVEECVLTPLRMCASFAEYEELPSSELADALRLQVFPMQLDHCHRIGQATGDGDGDGSHSGGRGRPLGEGQSRVSPAEWVEKMLPRAHLQALRYSVETYLLQHGGV
jgi:hypothetical protein